ncbi:MAG: ATP-grasp domain-containing protein [Actinomycetota bacterium]
MPRVMLLLPTATYRARDFQDAAQALGADVVIGTERKLAISAFARDLTLVVNLERPDEAADVIATFAERAPLDAVVGVDDQGVLAAAHAARLLGLAHNSPAAVAATRDKAALRRALGAAHVPQPRFLVAAPDDDVSALAGEIGFPCVLKPVSLAASRGVIRADDPEEAEAAAARIRAILERAGADRLEPLLVESYLPGAEVAVEGLLRRGVLEVLAVFDKPDPLKGPYFEETMFVTPSRLPAAVLEAVDDATRLASAALGLTEGPIHAELRVTDGRVAVLEVAARSIGGLCSRSLRFGAGATLEEVILRHALNMPQDGAGRQPGASGVMMIPIPTRGVLRAVEGQDEARAVPGVTGMELTIAPSRRVEPLPEGDRYLGFIFARGGTPPEVEETLRRAHAVLDVVIDPAP